MKAAFDITSVRLTLRQGIAKGYWTMEQLDSPSPGWIENAKRFRVHHPKYQQHEYRNPLRDEPSQVQNTQPVAIGQDYDTTSEFPF